MRVITGTARGRKLKSVEGMETRPTTDRTKESIFNIIQFDIEGRAVLDLFAGTGQMGIEALSRGARSADFIDTRSDCVKVIGENVRHTGFENVSRVHQMDYAAFLGRAKKESYGLIFLDPPYGNGFLQNALKLIFEKDLLMEGGLIVCEGLRTEEMPGTTGLYEKGREYLYGKSRIQLYIKKSTVSSESGEEA